MIPLIAAIVPYIPDIIRWVDGLVRGEKKGVDRKDMAVRLTRAATEKLIELGQVPAEDRPSDEVLGALIESRFQDLKSSGALLRQESGDLYLVRLTAMQKIEAM